MALRSAAQRFFQKVPDVDQQGQRAADRHGQRRSPQQAHNDTQACAQHADAARLPDGSWGSLYVGRNPKALPLELVGLTITVRARSGKSWDATITEVVERVPDSLLVRTRRLGD